MGGDGHKANETRRAGERIRHALEKAQHSFARAAALLTDPSPDNVGEALFHGALAILKIAESDPGNNAADRAEKIINALRENE